MLRQGIGRKWDSVQKSTTEMDERAIMLFCSLVRMLESTRIDLDWNCFISRLRKSWKDETEKLKRAFGIKIILKIRERIKNRNEDEMEVCGICYKEICNCSEDREKYNERITESSGFKNARLYYIHVVIFFYCYSFIYTFACSLALCLSVFFSSFDSVIFILTKAATEVSLQTKCKLAHLMTVFDWWRNVVRIPIIDKAFKMYK